jgi:transposase-like protein
LVPAKGIDERRVTAMAETKRMTAEQVVGYLLEEEGLDLLARVAELGGAALIEIEVSELVGAAHGERTPQEWLTHRNGYRPRTRATRARGSSSWPATAR